MKDDSRLEHFIEMLKLYQSTIDYFHLTLFSVKKDHKWIIYSSRILFLNKGLLDVIETTSSRTEEYRLISKLVKIDKIWDLFKNISEGYLRIDRCKYYLTDRTKENEDYHDSYSAYMKDEAEDILGEGLKLFTLYRWGNISEYLLNNEFDNERITNLISATDPPFYDPNDFLETVSLSNQHKRLTGNNRPELKLILPVYCVLDTIDTKFADNTLTISIRAVNGFKKKDMK